MFDHEKLDVYRLELEFIAWTTDLLAEVKVDGHGTVTREVRDQLDRASLSALLNTAEGNAKRQRAVRAKFFDDARGSTAESAACLDALVAKKVCSIDRVRPGKEKLHRIAQMLTKLVAMYSDSNTVREEMGACHTEP